MDNYRDIDYNSRLFRMPRLPPMEGNDEGVKVELKETLNLPKTAFPMKANLSTTEPQILQRWESLKLYESIRQTSCQFPCFYSSRWATLRQWEHPFGPCREQDSQRLHCKVQEYAGI